MNFYLGDETKKKNDYDWMLKMSKRSLQMCNTSAPVRPKNPSSSSCYANYKSPGEPSTLGEFRLPAARMSYVLDLLQDSTDDEDPCFTLHNPMSAVSYDNADRASPPEPLTLEEIPEEAAPAIGWRNRANRGVKPDCLESDVSLLPFGRSLPARQAPRVTVSSNEPPAPQLESVAAVSPSPDDKAPAETEDIAELALHSMVASQRQGCTSEDYMRAIERYLEESDEHELNEQDSRGRTALHLAVRHSNVEAIAGLLMCGADVNVADHRAKTPFTYCLDNYDMRNYKCNHMFYTFLGHVHKLIVIGLRVGAENRRCYARARSRHVFNDKQLQLSYAHELDKMEDVRVSWCTSLRDVLYQGADEIATSVLKRRTLEEILTASDFYQEFPKLCCLLKLQYRRGITRRKLMQPVKLALERLAGQGLPDPCTEAIIGHLDDDDDLMNLMRLGLEIRAGAAAGACGGVEAWD